MVANWQRGVLKALRVRNFSVEVLWAADITPWYRRVRFIAPGFFDDLQLYPSIWIRLWVPSLKRDMLVQRGYTVVDPDPASDQFSLDFVLHEPEGAAATWARNAAAGSTAEVAITPQRLIIDPAIGTVILAGDASAVPAINSILESLSDGTRAHVLVQEAHVDRAELPLGRADHSETTGQLLDPAPDGAAIVAAIDSLDLDPHDLFVWAAGERRLVKAIREHARGILALPRERQHAQYYWIQGKEGD